MKRNPWIIFFLIMLAIALPLCLFPINLFSGSIVIDDGIQHYTIDRPLSLSYFFGLGYDPADMTIVADFYLKPAGYLTAIIFIVGIPGLIAYRIFLKQSKS